MSKNLRSLIARICILQMLALSLFTPVHAAMLPADAALESAMAVESDRDRVDHWLAREDVRAQFLELGVAPQEVEQRVAVLSDAEVAMLAERMDEEPAGGLLAVIGVVFIVLLILELVGVTNIFTNVGPAR